MSMVAVYIYVLTSDLYTERPSWWAALIILALWPLTSVATTVLFMPLLRKTPKLPRAVVHRERDSS
jgi:hypothetical protein